LLIPLAIRTLEIELSSITLYVETEQFKRLFQLIVPTIVETIMKIKDFMQALYESTDNAEQKYQDTCDRLKIGDGNADISKIAVTMFATANVIREASAWGANLLIVHEPTFYSHLDLPEELDKSPQEILQVINVKREFIRRHGLTTDARIWIPRGFMSF